MTPAAAGQVCVTVLDPSALPGSSATLSIGGMAYFVVTFPASLPTPAGSAPVYVTLVRYRQPLYFWASGAITYSVNVTQGGGVFIGELFCKWLWRTSRQ